MVSLTPHNFISCCFVQLVQLDLIPHCLLAWLILNLQSHFEVEKCKSAAKQYNERKVSNEQNAVFERLQERNLVAEWGTANDGITLSGPVKSAPVKNAPAEDEAIDYEDFVSQGSSSVQGEPDQVYIQTEPCREVQAAFHHDFIDTGKVLILKFVN
jgi:hypothetical protein